MAPSAFRSRAFRVGALIEEEGSGVFRSTVLV